MKISGDQTRKRRVSSGGVVTPAVKNWHSNYLPGKRQNNWLRSKRNSESRKRNGPRRNESSMRMTKRQGAMRRLKRLISSFGYVIVISLASVVASLALMLSLVALTPVITYQVLAEPLRRFFASARRTSTSNATTVATYSSQETELSTERDSLQNTVNKLSSNSKGHNPKSKQP